MTLLVLLALPTVVVLGLSVTIYCYKLATHARREP
jgi:hypothetical protein